MNGPQEFHVAFMSCVRSCPPLPPLPCFVAAQAPAQSLLDVSGDGRDHSGVPQGVPPAGQGGERGPAVQAPPRLPRQQGQPGGGMQVQE